MTLSPLFLLLRVVLRFPVCLPGACEQSLWEQSNTRGIRRECQGVPEEKRQDEMHPKVLGKLTPVIERLHSFLKGHGDQRRFPMAGR